MAESWEKDNGQVKLLVGQISWNCCGVKNFYEVKGKCMTWVTRIKVPGLELIEANQMQEQAGGVTVCWSRTLIEWSYFTQLHLFFELLVKFQGGT